MSKIIKSNKYRYALCFFAFLAIVILCTLLTSPSGFNFKYVSAEKLYESLNGENNIVKVQTEDKININTAVISELMCLEQIGEKRAQDIINYRNEQGGFEHIDELMNISGISENIFEIIKDYVTIS